MNLRPAATTLQRTAPAKALASKTAPPRAARQSVRSAKILSIALLSIVCSGTLPAQRNERTIFQFQHTGWTAKDGAPAPTYAFAQTTDGFLWMATIDGLYRFDGIRFESYQLPPEVTSKLADVRTLMAEPDGGLWIGLNSGGAAFLKDGHTITYGQAQ